MFRVFFFLVENWNFIIKNNPDTKDAAHIALLIPSTEFFFLATKFWYLVELIYFNVFYLEIQFPEDQVLVYVW